MRLELAAIALLATTSLARRVKHLGGHGRGGTTTTTTGSGSNGGTMQQYSGPASNFPNPSTWQSFSFLWNQNAQLMTQAGHDSAADIKYIQSAITTVAAQSRVDARAILCTIMQESGGNVYVPTTNNGVNNPGIMQSHNGSSFNPQNAKASILQMVRDGTQGTQYGNGLQQCLAQYGQNYYEAFRCYNSGSVDLSNLSNGLGSYGPYVSDMANRLLGFVPN